MVDNVHVVQEDDEIIGIRRDEDDALQLARDTADDHEYGGHWDWYRSEEGSELVGWMSKADVTISVKKYAVL